jgi:hypothetical protein
MRIESNIPTLTETISFEKHYRVGDFARRWHLGRETVRLLVKDDPAVIKIRTGRKKAHTAYSVPESAARRIHTRLLNPLFPDLPSSNNYQLRQSACLQILPARPL